MKSARSLAVTFFSAWLIMACQPQDSIEATLPDAVTLELASHKIKPISSDVDWRRAHDCRAMTVLLQEGLHDGRVVDLEGTPFFLIEPSPALTRPEWLRVPGRMAEESGMSFSEARCVIRIGTAADRQSDHQIIGHERMRSRYQSGTRREKNPAYEVAQARLRKAEKKAKPGNSSITKVGDPLIDLVGILIGGALTGLGQWGAGDELEEALDALLATPSSIDHPVYKSYHFERTRVRARREAVLPVTLTDRQLQQSWQTSLKRREVRELFLVTGLDRQDEHYAQHQQDSVTEDGLQRWLNEAPALSLTDLAAGLSNQPRSIPIDRLALTNSAASVAKSGIVHADEVIDAAMLPKSLRKEGGSRRFEPPKVSSTIVAGKVKLIGEKGEVEGVFITPHLILAPSAVMGERGLIDVEDAPDHLTLGLVVAVDHGLGLALVQSPSKGVPVAFHGQLRMGHHALPVAKPASTTTRGETASPRSREKMVGPLLTEGGLIGFATKDGPDIDAIAIRMFLDQQRHLLPAEWPSLHPFPSSVKSIGGAGAFGRTEHVSGFGGR